MMPHTMVDNAAQRNQNSASGMMKRGIAGRMSSGILGTVGVCTKLKYHKSPIHMTPLRTCSQRTKKVQYSIPKSMVAPPGSGDRFDENDDDDGQHKTKHNGLA